MADIQEMARDVKGEWQPGSLPVPGALFRWPPEPRAIIKFLFGREGLLWPYNLLYLALAIISWLFLTPAVERMTTFAFDWMALIYLRNAGLLILIAGGLHLRLYIRRRQGQKYKYTDKWLARKDSRFLFHNQTLDNVFFSLGSGCIIWSGYEAITLWAYANKLLPYVDLRTRPVYFVLLMIGILFFRQIHFYWTHRFTHWKPLYKAAHYLHHKNVNVGPWSGLSMHPIEHLLYFSGVFIHWVILSHPLHAIFHGLHAGLSPAKGHSGFYKIVLNDKESTEKERALKAGGYFHYLHHRFFTVNYGNEGVPLDKWFGSFHDGSDEAHAAMVAKRKKRRQSFQVENVASGDR